jgi:AcrR family transcriptional regulator
VDKRETILDAARTRFAQFGMKKTTVEEIARDAGVGKAAIYEHFAGKEALLAAVVRHESDLLLSLVQRAVAETPGGAREKLRALVLAKVRHLKGLRNFNGYQIETFPEMRPLVREEGRRYRKQERKIVEGILAEGTAAGVLDVPDLEMVAFAIVMSLKEVEVTWVAERGRIGFEQGVEMLLHLLFEGIQKR